MIPRKGWDLQKIFMRISDCKSDPLLMFTMTESQGRDWLNSIPTISPRSTLRRNSLNSRNTPSRTSQRNSKCRIEYMR